MQRRLTEPRLKDPAEGDAERPPEAAPLPALVQRLQQTAGNAAVGRILARTPGVPGTEPDSRRGESMLGALLSGASSAADLLEEGLGSVPGMLGFGDKEQAQNAAPPTTAPATTSTSGTATTTTAAPAAAPDPLEEWRKKTPSTNQELATWIVDAETHGFVVWTATATKGQLQDLAAGTKVQSADPTKDTTIGALYTLHALIDAKAAKWAADKTKPKEPLAVGSFLRGDAHRFGTSIDINKLDWTSAEGPEQVIELLKMLPKGNYGIGLPFQGEFFPADEWFDAKGDAAVAAAKEGEDPKPITDPLLRKGVTGRYTAVWSKEAPQSDGSTKPGWVFTSTGSAFSRLKSADLKKGIGELNGAGYSIYVFPDNDNHIHVQHP